MTRAGGEELAEKWVFATHPFAFVNPWRNVKVSSFSGKDNVLRCTSNY
jgi:hypothetical protein